VDAMDPHILARTTRWHIALERTAVCQAIFVSLGAHDHEREIHITKNYLT
jgi:hypothetical protein